MDEGNSQKPLLLGLSGKAGSGKSTVAEYLCQRHGYYALAFADALKDVVGIAFGFTAEQFHGDLKEVVDERWGVTPRWCLQWLGTDVLRAKWPDFWIRHLRQDLLDFLAQNGQRPVVVTDVRFVDEAKALKQLGAKLIRIERPDGARRGGCAVHVSETELDEWPHWDHVIDNNGSLDELFCQVDSVLKGKNI